MIIVSMMAARSAPRWLPAKVQLRLPKATPLNARSAQLLVKQILPSSMEAGEVVPAPSLFLARGASLVGTAAVNGALDLEQRIQAPDRLQRDRRDRFAFLAFSRILLDVSQLEEAPPRMGQAKRRSDRRRFLLRIEQRFEAAVAIGLQDAGEGDQMPLRVFASSVARGVIDRRRRRGPGKGSVIPWRASGDRHLGSSSDTDDVLLVGLRELF